MRLIDKDALLEAIGEEYDDSDVEFMKGVYSQWKCDTDIIKSFPEIDQWSEIVRCKDCQHYMTIHCTCDGCCISPDWFCADGRKVAKLND